MIFLSTKYICFGRAHLWDTTARGSTPYNPHLWHQYPVITKGLKILVVSWNAVCGLVLSSVTSLHYSFWRDSNNNDNASCWFCQVTIFYFQFWLRNGNWNANSFCSVLNYPLPGQNIGSYGRYPRHFPMQPLLKKQWNIEHLLQLIIFFIHIFLIVPLAET